MIRLALVAVARFLFGAGLLTLALGAGIIYLSYRLIRVVIRDDKTYPVKDAAFGALISVAILAKAIKAEQERRAID